MKTISLLDASVSKRDTRIRNFLILAGEVSALVGPLEIRLGRGQFLPGHCRIAPGDDAIVLEVDGPSGIEDYFNSFDHSVLSGTMCGISFPAQSLAKLFTLSLTFPNLKPSLSTDGMQSSRRERTAQAVEIEFR